MIPFHREQQEYKSHDRDNHYGEYKDIRLYPNYSEVEPNCDPEDCFKDIKGLKEYIYPEEIYYTKQIRKWHSVSPDRADFNRVTVTGWLRAACHICCTSAREHWQ
ncbi:MAG: hypothetical protein RBG13Loki_4353 [Promethearchaeota archaeon CR_4]|nr:MAG: hypothetical protein RBG13Loki_4353 [Candidatus Lokiarchaeota archaeon CR_4]